MRRRRWPWWLLAGALALAALAGVPAWLLLAETTPPAPPAERPIVPAPEGAGLPDPVTGEVAVETTDVSPAGSRLFGSSMAESQPIEPDGQAARALGDEIAALLDRHLTRLQEGEPGLPALTGLDGPSGALALADRGDPVERARYQVEVAARGAPKWAVVTIRVALRSGDEHRARLVFEPTEDGPRLVAAEGDGPVASRADDDEGEA